MTLAIFFIAAVLLGTASTGVSQGVPIPKRPPRGFVYNASSCTAPVELKVFVDLTCPDCKAAWPTLLQVAEVYNHAHMVTFEVLIFPLPYHRASFPAAQVSYVLNKIAPEKVYTWFTYMFKNQAKYYNSAILKQSQDVVLQMFADDLFTATGIKQSETLPHLVDSDASREDAIVMWKYACSRTVSGTPTALINDVRIDFGIDWTLDDWSKVINPLLKNQEYSSPKKSCPAGEERCEYLPGKIECCLSGEACIPNVGCRC
ncbi:uncharacterized protein LOC117291388 [Asterias rubens]|uniref:uncharacterized protein LOC117291388 n=1 Tax=Asterias rubens TaxID=7604 RepID=UPI0014550CA8|nr:uncharacterized protein LOC117291388 [Asterias rubens]